MYNKCVKLVCVGVFFTKTDNLCCFCFGKLVICNFGKQRILSFHSCLHVWDLKTCFHLKMTFKLQNEIKKIFLCGTLSSSDCMFLLSFYRSCLFMSLYVVIHGFKNINSKFEFIFPRIQWFILKNWSIYIYIYSFKSFIK